MKKALCFCATALMILAGASACQPQTDNSEPEGVRVDKETLDFLGTGGSQTVTVTGPDWTTSEDEEWIIVEEFEGSFKVTADATVEAREGAITVSNNVNSVTVTVKQAAIDGAISVDKPTLDFEGPGGTQTVGVTSLIAGWTAVADKDWITVTPNENGRTFDVTVGAHAEDGTRTGTITVSNGKEEATVNVEQADIPYKTMVAYNGIIQNVTGYNNLNAMTLRFWGAKVNASLSPVEDCWNVSVQIIIDAVDKEQKTFDFPVGTYAWSKTQVATPFLLESSSNFVYPPGANSFGERIGATGGKMVVTGEDAERTVKITYTLEDGTTFKAMFEGRTAVNNPLISGLMEDVDLGTVGMTGWLDGDAGALKWGPTYTGVLWHYHFATEGVTFNAETQAAEGTGYYIMLKSTVTSVIGRVAGAMAEAGTYDIGVGTPSVFTSAFGVTKGSSSGTTDNGAWIYRLQDGVVMDRAPFMSGTIGISYVDPNHTFVINAVDNLGNKITGTLSGPLRVNKMTV
jgi:hypothetical protein